MKLLCFCFVLLNWGLHSRFRHLIKRLIENYDVRNMIVDETSDELYLHKLQVHEAHHFQPFFGDSVTHSPLNPDAPYTYGPPTHYGENGGTNYYQSMPHTAHSNYIYRPQRMRYVKTDTNCAILVSNKTEAFQTFILLLLL